MNASQERVRPRARDLTTCPRARQVGCLYADMLMRRRRSPLDAAGNKNCVMSFTLRE